jgi:hypothetical protein
VLGVPRTARRSAAVRPTPDLEWALVRLRPLTEAECYARCYGGRQAEAVFVHTAYDSRRQLAAISQSDRDLLDHIGHEGASGPRREAA